MASTLQADRRMQDAHARADTLAAEGRTRHQVWDALIADGLTEGEADVVVPDAFDRNYALAHRKRNLRIWGGLLVAWTVLMLRFPVGPVWLGILPAVAYSFVQFACAAAGKSSPFR